MMQSAPILLGRYRPLDSYLHRLDARAKLVPVLLVMILSLLTESPWFYVTLLVMLIGGLAASGIEARTLLLCFRPILVLVAITFLYHVIFSARDTEPVAEIFGWAITSGGLSKGLFFSLRLTLFVAVVFLITLTNSPSELAEALTKLLRPLERLRIPVSDLGVIVFIALRFIPILYEEFAAIRNAQLIRGVDFTGNLVNRARKTGAILIPVLINAIGRADDLALAMEARGYQGGFGRTFYSKARFDRTALVFTVATSVAIMALYLGLG